MKRSRGGWGWRCPLPLCHPLPWVWTFCLFSCSHLSLSHLALSPRSPPWPLWSRGGGRAGLCPSQGQKDCQGGSAGGEGRGQKVRYGDPKHQASQVSVAALPQKRGWRGAGMTRSPASPVQPLSFSSPTPQGRSWCVCQAQCHLEATGYFSVCSDRHIWLMNPWGLLFCCCLIINHLNGDVSSPSRLHPHPQREPSDPFEHCRSKMGYLADKPGQSERA